MPISAKIDSNNSSDEHKFVRTLIVDDDTAYSHLLSRYLAKDKNFNYHVDTVSTAMIGITKCLLEEYDLMLVDYNLPDLSGPEFLVELRTRISGTAPPTIILTAGGGETAAGQALRADAADFLPKVSVNPESLARSINNAIAKHSLRAAVDSRTTELQNANESLQAKNREIQHFYQTVSHEVKTPLSAAREFISIIRDELAGPVTAEQIEVLDYAITSCDQIATHFNDLVEITRLDSNKVSLEKTPCTVDSLITRTTAACANALRASKLTLNQKIDNRERVIWVDDNRITQVLANLVGNAIKYSPTNSTISLTTKENADSNNLIFCISDTGCGISHEDQSRIFDRLYQASEVNHEFMGAGLGLGLTIAKEIVALHDGQLWVESEVGTGSSFYFEIPIQLPKSELH